ncbi:hypothetical protein [Thalassomonas haliotis]|uniref:Uncharacterized protein n=1 Tax=Thalassomonas haliotis TaxID=485448 RepID=A0ABY7VFZ6_9GAMM|nr:hypothetical protein [Thalassomonas haliotis]WDE12322.1 hypothetical protein H3N35_02220 [Thalassomonas haliotis]
MDVKKALEVLSKLKPAIEAIVKLKPSNEILFTLVLIFAIVVAFKM